MKTSSYLFFLIVLISLFLSIEAADDYYKILGIPRNANERQLKKAYHKQSLKYHPDKNESPEAQEKFIKINAAYEILSDPEKRKLYDQYGSDYFTNPRNQQGNGGPGPGAGAGGGGGGPGGFPGGFGSAGPGGSSFHFSSTGNSDGFKFSDPMEQFARFFGGGGGGSMFGNLFGGQQGQGRGPKKSSGPGGPGGPGANFGFGQSGHPGPGGGSAHPSPAEDYGPDVILISNPKVFNEKIKNFVGDPLSNIFMVEFVSPTCGHCKKLKPEFQKAAKALKGVIKYAAVDCSSEKMKSICTEYQVNSYPSIQAFNNKKVEKYTGDRSAKALYEFSISLFTSYVYVLKEPNKILPFMNKNESDNNNNNVLPKVFYFTKNNSVPPAYRLLSNQLHKQALFAAVVNSDDSSRNEYLNLFDLKEGSAQDLKGDNLIFINFLGKDGEFHNRLYKGKFSFSKIKEWINSFLKGYDKEKPSINELTKVHSITNKNLDYLKAMQSSKSKNIIYLILITAESSPQSFNEKVISSINEWSPSLKQLFSLHPVIGLKIFTIENDKSLKQKLLKNFPLSGEENSKEFSNKNYFILYRPAPTFSQSKYIITPIDLNVGLDSQSNFDFQPFLEKLISGSVSYNRLKQPLKFI